MKTPRSKPVFLALLPVLLLVLLVGYSISDQGGLSRVFKDAEAPFDDQARVGADLSLSLKTVLVKEEYQGGLFRTETRKDKMERFQCSRCHDKKVVTTARAAEVAHGDVVLVHGSKEKPLACLTCHKDEDRDLLVTEAGIDVDLDHSYQLCGHCHFRQKKDWVGGAHGKRIEYWAGERVVMNCTSCHDPHSPRFAKRWPATYSSPLAR